MSSTWTSARSLNVTHHVVIPKLEIYGFEGRTVWWVNN